MATVTITIPNAVTTRVVNAICTISNYQDTINGSPNPVTKTEFFKKWLISHIIETVKAQENNTAIDNAVTAVNTDIQTNIIIT